MDNLPESVTCSDRVKMNALAGILFVLGGDAILLFVVTFDRSTPAGVIVTGLFGVAGVLVGVYYMCCFLNRRITVSDEGVVYADWKGTKLSCGWDKVRVEYNAGRNAYFTFIFNGKKKAVFYGYSYNAELLYEWLFAKRRFDADSMRIAEKTEEQKAERVRRMQLQARTSGDADNSEE